MLAIALGALGLAGLTALLAYWRDRWQTRGFDRKEQAWTTERGILLDRLADLSGRPWTVSPRETPAVRDVETRNQDEIARAELASRW